MILLYSIQYGKAIQWLWQQRETQSLNTIIPYNEDHVQALADLCAQAFHDDPLYEYAFPEAATRASLARWEFEGLVRYGVRFGEVQSPADLSGCAVWLPPGETDFTEERMAQVGMEDLAMHIGSVPDERLERFIFESEHWHRQVAPGPHWYLVLLAVDPSQQGRGLGNMLLTAGWKRADVEGYPVYLETTNPRNVPFYERCGFEVRKQAALSDGSIDVWYMVRMRR